MITLSTLSINIIASWLRRVRDPLQRWRFELKKKSKISGPAAACGVGTAIG